MRKSYLFILLFLAWFQSCNKQHLLVDTINTEFDVSTFDTIKGVDTGIDVLGINDIYSFYGMLFVESPKLDKQLHVYSCKNDSLIMSFCSTGRAKNEFIYSSNPHKQICLVDDHILLPINDNRMITKIVDITESMEVGHTIVKDIIESQHPSRISSIFLSNFSKSFQYCRAYSTRMDFSDYEIPHFLRIDSISTVEIPVYGKLIEHSQMPYFPEIIYRGNMRISPNEKYIVFFHINMNYLLVFNLENNSVFAIHKNDEQSIEDDFPIDPRGIRLGYGDICLSDKYIYTLMPNGTEDDYENTLIMPLLGIFDYDGNFINGFVFDRQIFNISYDTESGKLYGFELLTEKIYEYNNILN